MRGGGVVAGYALGMFTSPKLVTSPPHIFWSSMSSKLPALQLYSGDWHKDPGIRSLSLASRGLWFEMLLIMHNSERRGRLTLNNKPISNEKLSRIVCATLQEIHDCLLEIEEAGVSSKDEGGVIYSRRMIREEEARKRNESHNEARRRNGHKGKDHGWKGGRSRVKNSSDFSEKNGQKIGEKQDENKPLEKPLDSKNEPLAVSPRKPLESNLVTPRIEPHEKEEKAFINSMVNSQEKGGEITPRKPLENPKKPPSSSSSSASAYSNIHKSGVLYTGIKSQGEKRNESLKIKLPNSRFNLSKKRFSGGGGW